MHGTCARPETIILTRHDYSQMANGQTATEGVLQALLMTQHLLFVGFSMRDENWCRIVETVRASAPPVFAAPRARPPEPAAAHAAEPKDGEGNGSWFF